MSEFTPDSSLRVKGVTIVKPIVFGNVAKYFGKKREDDGHTHNWTVYVKPYKNEDMSAYIKKVHFKLHDSYQNQNRILSKPPYEVSETGWGEFEITIKLHFVDPNEKPVTIVHMLKLFDTDPMTKQIQVKKCLTSEFYDEIIFHEPSTMMHQLLKNAPQLSSLGYRHETDFEEKKEKNMQSILNAKNNVRNEIEVLKEKLKGAQETILQHKKELQSKNDQNSSATEQ